MKILGQINRIAIRHGLDIKKFVSSIHHAPDWVDADYETFISQKGKDESFEFIEFRPIRSDKYDEGGVMKGHYFHQDLYVARLIHEAKPVRHLDIGSRVDGFVAHVATFREIEIIDIRNIKSSVKNIVFKQADLMELQPELVGCCDSVSSLHAIEHFGLGRYGDPIDYMGHLKAISNIADVLVKGGVFYLSVPIGPQRVEFNAHRVFSVSYMIDLLLCYFKIVSFSYVDDCGDFHEDAEFTQDFVKSNYGCYYGCGIFILEK